MKTYTTLLKNSAGQIVTLVAFVTIAMMKPYDRLPSLSPVAPLKAGPGSVG